MKVTIYTDGSSRGNPGPGGFGAILIYGAHRKELSGGFRMTTNNRMELLAVIRAIEALNRDNLELEIHTDSRYVMDAFEKKWIIGWQKKAFQKVKNPDLWKTLIALVSKHHVRFKWVRGHSGHPLNERCDELATSAADGKHLDIDLGYESGI